MDPRSFREICRTTAGRDTIEIIAGKLDDMLKPGKPMMGIPGYPDPAFDKPGMSDDQVEIARLRSLNIQERERAEKAEAALAAFTRATTAWRLHKAAIALYRAGWWTADIAAGDQVRLWTELRDALGLPAGGSTKPYFHVTNTPRSNMHGAPLQRD